MKKILILVVIFSFVITGYRICHPTRIIGIHQVSENIIVLVVQHFPWTKQGKISWWQRNQSGVFSKLNIQENNYSVFIYNTCYKKDSGTDQDSDLLCFKDMATEESCISKENRPLIIWRYRDGHTEYTTESIFRRFY
ncbi:hypothetical protein B1H58_12925 [Pantoea alhagi]|uniref:Uncharacterized protein n=1 Tax=Pantoea alhagi TaxID=1891675 RepID=A0A1W6B6X6_9GAMM|nr:DUF943 family protein [Pantoea alhagi]ARJ42841.1 hypothetical protein B1H58_12925 [Pantoea alhagi]